MVEDEGLVPYPKLRQQLLSLPPGGGAPGFEDLTNLTPWERQNMIERDRAQRLREPATAIMYIAAIMDHHARNYERLSRYPALSYDIRKDVGVLCQLYQAGDSQGSASRFQDRFIADPNARPIVGDEMGKWARNNINFVRNLLEI